jgi:hypothetical protein
MRYFFNLAGSIYDPDNDGIELANHYEARIMAVTQAAELMRDQPHVVWTGDEFRVEVTNADQMLLFTLIVVGVDSPAVSKTG